VRGGEQEKGRQTARQLDLAHDFPHPI